MERKTYTWKRGMAGLIVGAAVLVTVAAPLGAWPSSGGWFSDDFNRPDTPSMYPDWYEQHGDWNVVGGAAHSAVGESGTCCSLMTVNGITDPQPVVQVTVAYDGDPRATYAAIVLLYLDNETNAFIKIQDGYAGSPPDGLFDTVYFYKGNNGGTEEGGEKYRPLVPDVRVWDDLAPYFSTAVLTAWVEGDTVYLSVDRDFDGQPDPADIDLDGEPDAYFYTRAGIPTEEFGSGVGLGGFNGACCDDFIILPEPCTLVLVGLGAAGLLAARRRRRT
jgi:hypothetical protein